MKRYFKDILMLSIIALSLSACDSAPRVIEAESQTTHLHSNDKSPDAKTAINEDPASKEHKVKVEEVLNASSYTYLNVSEDNEKYWIAISKSDVKAGDVIYYRGGLLQQNFKSKDLDREFEMLYLVSAISDQPSTSTRQMPSDNIHKKAGMQRTDPVDVGTIQPAKGAITLSELFSNKEKYQDQQVKVTGKCVKVNNEIMGRNWIHIQDGTGEGLDLTVTTQEQITMGKVITMEGKITLDKDFGAGYKYAIIMEEAVLK